MIWASPWAWALAVAAVLPIVAHLWSRKRPATLLFPTLRFLQAASPISRRLHRVQDWPLLLVRLAAVAMICAAAAGPTIASSWRRQAWRQRLHRIVLVDAAVGDTHAALADLQPRASSSTVIGPVPIRDALDEALAQAKATASRMRTELVLVFDGTRAAVSASDVDDVTPDIGLRFVVVDRLPDTPATAAAMGSNAGVTVQNAGQDTISESMRAGLARLTLPSAAVPITVGWGNMPAPQAADGNARPAVLSVHDALDAMAVDPRVRDAAERSDVGLGETGRYSRDARIAVLARTPDGQPLLRGWSDGRGLVLDLDARPRSSLTWWATVAAREALTTMELDSGQRWSASDLARASRDATLPPDSALPGGLDTRLAWGLALVLLVAEQVWRGRRDTPGGLIRDGGAPTHRDEASDAA